MNTKQHKPGACLWLAALVSLSALAGTAVADARQPAAIDLARYSGTWHEIARIPHFFQRKCLRDVTATYTLQPDHLQVVNRCITADGETMSVTGKAFVQDAPTNRKLTVGFFEILGWMPFTGDYWIRDIDPDYRWAIVGGPGNEYGWILARSPQLEPALRADIDRRLRGLGYDPAAFSHGSAPGR
jgi:apolipoprotein D and lipocalin family protein